MNWMKTWVMLAVATVVGVSSISCEKKEGAPTAEGGTEKKLSVVYIPKNTGNPYFDSVSAGFDKACKEAGAKFATIAPATADATSQLPIIKDQIQRGVNVLAITPNSPDALVPALRDAMRRGITVVTVDSDLTGNEDARAACVLTVDPQSVGESQVELMGSLIGYRGEFAILSATTDAPNQNQWISIMKKTLETNPKYKEMKLVDVVYGNDEPQKSLTETEALLTKHPSLGGIISPTTVGIAAAAQCVETAGKAQQVKVTGLGTPNQMRRYIKSGTVEAFALWSPADQGYLAGQLSIQIAGGTLKPEVGAKFTGGTLGERTVGEKNLVITGPPVTFTRENIDQYNF